MILPSIFIRPMRPQQVIEKPPDTPGTAFAGFITTRKDGKRSGLHARLRSQRIEVPLKFIKPPLKPHLGDGENLELASIIELMNNYDLFHKQNPLYSGSQILGRDTSIGVVDFLRRYIDYHIEQPLALTLF